MRRYFASLVLAGLLVANTSQASFDLGKWPFYKEVEVAGPGLSSLGVDDEIFATAKGELQDLRLVDGHNQEVPYKILNSQSSAERQDYLPKILNNYYDQASKKSSAVLYIGDHKEEVNRLLINTATVNFRANVTISGSDEPSDWKTLSEKNYIYDYTDARASWNSRDTEVNFPASVFKYLKIEIEADSRPVRINSVQASRWVEERAKEVARQPKFEIKENAKGKSTEIYLDFEKEGLPISRLELETKSNNFGRQASVWVSRDNSNWSSVLSGAYIYKYEADKFSGQSLRLDFSETNYRYLKLVIENRDNRPLEITGLKSFSVYRSVVFEAQSGENYRLFYGNLQAEAPSYDFESFLNFSDKDKIKSAKLSGQKNNDSYISPEVKPVVTPKSEKVPYLLPGALTVSIFLLGWLLYKFFKKS